MITVSVIPSASAFMNMNIFFFLFMARGMRMGLISRVRDRSPMYFQSHVLQNRFLVFASNFQKMTVLAVPEKWASESKGRTHKQTEVAKAAHEETRSLFVPLSVAFFVIFQPFPLFTLLLHSWTTLSALPFSRLLPPRAHSTPLNSCNNNADTLCTAHLHSNHSFLLFSTHGQRPASTATTASAR